VHPFCAVCRLFLNYTATTKVLFKTCVAMTFVVDDDDGDDESCCTDSIYRETVLRAMNVIEIQVRKNAAPPLL